MYNVYPVYRLSTIVKFVFCTQSLSYLLMNFIIYMCLCWCGNIIKIHEFSLINRHKNWHMEITCFIEIILQVIFLRNGSIELQGFICLYFVENFKLLHENVKTISYNFCCIQNLQTSEVTTVSCGVYTPYCHLKGKK